MKIIYENLEDLFGLFDSNYQTIFDSMISYGLYNKIGVAFLIASILFFAPFYFLYKNPYARLFPHWTVTLLVSSLIASTATFFILRQGLAEYILDSDQEVVAFTNNLILFYTITNLLLAALFGLAISFLLRKGSKVQPHLPF
ncbi:hypothetical protein ACV07N_13265 [Roseivirga echinicomitans]